MGYVSNDSRLWFNLAGCVAAYQPVRAPGPMLARYNQAYGGINKYKAVDGVAPTWSAVNSWAFNGATQYLTPGVIPANDQSWSALVRFSGGDLTAARCLFGQYTGGSNQFDIYSRYTAGLDQVAFRNGGERTTAPSMSSGCLAVAGNLGYRDGVVNTLAIPAGSGTNTRSVYIGAISVGSPTHYFKGNILVLCFYNRTLSPAEVWTVTRQMQYCDVNPDWSAWGRRREWFFMPSVGAVRILPNTRGVVGLGGGVSIEPLGKVGL